MLQLIEANWIAFAVVLAIGVLVAWWIFRQGSTIERPRRPDALDEGAAPASRNQALIDAPPASELTPPPAAGTMAGIGEIVTVAAQDEAEEQAALAAEAKAEAPSPADTPPSDDLSRIKGVGPKLVALLESLGVTRYQQIAAWSDEDIDRIDPQLGAFAGRPRRDSWVEQAKLLASGDTAAYEAKFGKL